MSRRRSIDIVYFRCHLPGSCRGGLLSDASHSCPHVVSYDALFALYEYIYRRRLLQILNYSCLVE